MASHNVGCHPTQVNVPALPAARQAGALRWFTCLLTVTHPSSNHLITTLPAVELTWLPDCKSDTLTLHHKATRKCRKTYTP